MSDPAWNLKETVSRASHFEDCQTTVVMPFLHPKAKCSICQKQILFIAVNAALLSGYSVREVAKALRLTAPTVGRHAKRCLPKFPKGDLFSELQQLERWMILLSDRSRDLRIREANRRDE